MAELMGSGHWEIHADGSIGYPSVEFSVDEVAHLPKV